MLDSLLVFDCRLFWLINGAHSPLLDVFMLILTELGNAAVLGPILVGIILWKTPREYVKWVLIFGIVGLSSAGLGNAVVKATVRRPRPITYFERNPESCERFRSKKTAASGETPSEVHLVGPTLRYRSFPSGHTNTAFAAAFLLAILYGGFFRFAFIPALAVGYTRVYLGVHFPGDIAGGAITGVFFMFVVYLAFERWAPSFPPNTGKPGNKKEVNSDATPEGSSAASVCASTTPPNSGTQDRPEVGHTDETGE